ncbi:MAG: SMC-Scp complex subunit ScpB [Ferruginibacter sp.]
MELSQIIPHIEALIFASDKPLTNLDLVELLNNAMGFIDDRATLDQVETAVDGIREKYSAEFYAFELKQSGGGWQFLTKKEYHKTIAQLNGDKFLKRLSNAALETLAIIAYKQPITKSEIESIRGVNCDYAVQKLLEKDLVIIAGRNEEAVGKPLIYTTSKSFMDYFGINSTDDLPKISEVMMEELVKATVITDGQQQETETNELEGPVTSALIVTQSGEIVENILEPGSTGNEVADKSAEAEAKEELKSNDNEEVTDNKQDAVNDKAGDKQVKDEEEQSDS